MLKTENLLPDRAVREFKKMYEEKLGREISHTKARSLAENFINMYQLINQRYETTTEIG
ncbi:MAG: hypothetical protein HN846_00045 [Candidatus Pacebacteria bacterium]|jgi:hypothetical protein|nr:hypothetical protein [Candidatus Paceibacterota bacterium]MBT3512168.1 hypothetical protein [Candidatus Paceibacterota bacterium]MBT4004895.1 hypothetical protein [Candidatus Paceibacterota bacterium]MBT4358663.1 hypothetical protein [Candidatus Paceibacterota bacterium]MBT4681342.1 hypothetical protein [Candidatus Paceibacterota bacterium]